MRKNRVSRIIGTLSVLAVTLFLAGCGGGGGSNSSSTAGEGTTNPADAVTFTYVLDSGQLNSLPAGADHIDVVLDGRETNYEVTARITVYAEANSSETGAQTLTFHVTPGEHFFTITALQGTTPVAIIGPIPFTKVRDIPATIPMAFAFTRFENSRTYTGTAALEPYLGTPYRDRIVQFGGTANDLLSVDLGASDDWSEQYGGDGNDIMVTDAGTGKDYIYQDGGDGDNNLTVTAGIGDDWVFQKDGAGNDIMNLLGGDGNDHLHQEGGAGNDTIHADPGLDKDTVTIDAGSGDDSITYDVSSGTDTVTIDGGDGTDTLTIITNGYPVIVRDSNGIILYNGGAGGTIITVRNIENPPIIQ